MTATTTDYRTEDLWEDNYFDQTGAWTRTQLGYTLKSADHAASCSKCQRWQPNSFLAQGSRWFIVCVTVVRQCVTLSSDVFFLFGNLKTSQEFSRVQFTVKHKENKRISWISLRSLCRCLQSFLSFCLLFQTRYCLKPTANENRYCGFAVCWT